MNLVCVYMCVCAPKATRIAKVKKYMTLSIGIEDGCVLTNKE